MSGFKLFLQGWQAFAFFPMIEVRGLLSAIESRGMVTQVVQRVGLKFLMQQLSDDVTYLLDRETRGDLFPPAASLASRTKLLST